ncbi:hypothetical protein [Streptomyces sp. WELS2]|uniref:hypothetical protein n=1 Tax=Streptomyces sp. WELS2 TaxID=2749435 RepID=UPI0015F01004|nr:hypothetical protein [Streptomyces sp. WELS2]
MPAGPCKMGWTFELSRQIPQGDFPVHVQSYIGDDKGKDFTDLLPHVDFRPQ